MIRHDDPSVELVVSEVDTPHKYVQHELSDLRLPQVGGPERSPIQEPVHRHKRLARRHVLDWKRPMTGGDCRASGR
jgi:hypothetical protein